MMARIMLTIPDELLANVDEAAKNAHRSRSEFLREAARAYLSKAQYPQLDEQAAGKVVREAAAAYDTYPQFEGPSTMTPQLIEQIQAIEKLLEKVQSVIAAPKAKDLFGAWKDSVPADLDVDAILSDVRGSWQSEMQDILS